jgi:hypothetical protein
MQTEDDATCDGFCGEATPYGCYCDAVCEQYGDCCGDFADQCDFGTPTCEGSCGEGTMYGCYCDDLCPFYNDCCGDYEDLCAEFVPVVEGQICAGGYLDGSDGGFMFKKGHCEQKCVDTDECAAFCFSKNPAGDNMKCLMFTDCDNFSSEFENGADASSYTCFAENPNLNDDEGEYGSDDYDYEYEYAVGSVLDVNVPESRPTYFYVGMFALIAMTSVAIYRYATNCARRKEMVDAKTSLLGVRSQ